MANAFYTPFKEGLLGKDHDMDADAIKIYLVDLADYTFSAAHDEISDVAVAGRVATATLASTTIASGVFDSADGSFTAVTGDVSEALIMWNDTPTTPIADPLVCFYDTSVTGFPVTPNGGDINFTVHASGWFSL